MAMEVNGPSQRKWKLGIHILLVAAFIIQESNAYGEMFTQVMYQSSSTFSISGS